MTDASSSSKLPRLGLTHGDINGIGYEIILKAFADTRMLGLMTPILYGQSKALSYYKKNFGLDDFTYSLTRDARQAWNQKFNVINIVDQELKIEPGAPTPTSAEMSVYALKKAVEDLRDGYIDGLVMAPVCSPVEKGQRDFLSASFGKPDMLQMLVNGSLRIGLATGDVALRDAIDSIDANLVATKLATFSKALKTDFAIASPKLVVANLDPHPAGTGVVAEAIAQAQQRGVFAFGPFSVSQLFATGLWRKYDGVLAMTYEQGMLPFRMLTQDGGASYWAGMPVVCANPVHGPAFDIANANKARPDDFRAALYLAIDIVRHRADKN